MNKFFSVLFVAATALSVYSCKKTQHPTNPTPANYRVLSYTETINGTYSYVYTFSYDAKNRVSQIIQTTSDSLNVKYGAGVGSRSLFYYSNDSILKVTTNLRTNAPIDSELFLTNNYNQITTTYIPANSNTTIIKASTQYEYYGKLLSKATDKYYHNAMSVGASRVYTSDNADFLGYNFDNTLTTTVSNSYTNPVAIEYIYTDLAHATAHPASNYTDVLSGYTNAPITVVAVDQASHTDTIYFPGGTLSYESYGVFPDKDNRPGDYMWIKSFTAYGIDMFQQAHLTKSIKNVHRTTNIVYDIDADSKIKTTTATVIDSINRPSITETYNFQYETY